MDRDIIRHLIAAVAYRASKVIEDTSSDFPTFEAGQGVRTPLVLLHHITTILGRAEDALTGKEHAKVEIADWPTEVNRFYALLERLDNAVANGAEPRGMTWEQILQGPIADALTHIGQLATLRRLAGEAMTRESYIQADIRAGRLRTF